MTDERAEDLRKKNEPSPRDARDEEPEVEGHMFTSADPERKYDSTEAKRKKY